MSSLQIPSQADDWAWIGRQAELGDGEHLFTREQLMAEVRALALKLRSAGTRVLATLLDNGPAWVIADLAAQDLVHVPLPLFFSAAQRQHALQHCGADSLILPASLADAMGGLPREPLTLAGQALCLLRLPGRAPLMPEGTAKITFTSGTTGAPKGVCLTNAAMHGVAASLVQALEPLDLQRHLCALPLAVLLENIAGVLAPLRRGATVLLPALSQLGLSGSSGFDVQRFDQCVRQFAPHSLILLPQMLRAWVAWLARSGQQAPPGLRLVAVGGAAVGQALLSRARALNIPAYEGYGLSEGSSVQTLNLPWADCPGSAGRALPHAQIRIAGDGEIELRGSLFSGYVGESTAVPAWWPSGDLGELDAQGILHIRGRKKHVLITSFGRNVSPEWVETALRSQDAIAQAVVFGEAMPSLCAVLWPSHGAVDAAALEAAVTAANATLPDYARIGRWCMAQGVFGPESGLATANGRPIRAQIWHAHRELLGDLSDAFSS